MYIVYRKRKRDRSTPRGDTIFSNAFLYTLEFYLESLKVYSFCSQRLNIHPWKRRQLATVPKKKKKKRQKEPAQTVNDVLGQTFSQTLLDSTLGTKHTRVHAACVHKTCTYMHVRAYARTWQLAYQGVPGTDESFHSSIRECAGFGDSLLIDSPFFKIITIDFSIDVLGTKSRVPQKKGAILLW